MLDKVLLIAYIMSNWEEFITSLETYSAIAGEVVDYEQTAEFNDAIADGQLTYSEYTEALELKFESFVHVDWGEEEWEDEDTVTVAPDHIYINWPDTELVLVDLMNAADWFVNKVDWECIASVIFKFMGVAYNTSLLGMFFAVSGEDRIPWTHKLMYRDGTTGVVDVGENFEPEKNIKWGQIEGYVIKGMAIGFILYILHKTGLVGKIWKSFKMGLNWRTKRIVRQTLNTLSDGLVTLNGVIESLDAKVVIIDGLIDQLTTATATMQEKIDSFSTYKPYG